MPKTALAGTVAAFEDLGFFLPYQPIHPRKILIKRGEEKYFGLLRVGLGLVSSIGQK